jgi:hypothetical protein
MIDERAVGASAWSSSTIEQLRDAFAAYAAGLASDRWDTAAAVGNQQPGTTTPLTLPATYADPSRAALIRPHVPVGREPGRPIVTCKSARSGPSRRPGNAWCRAGDPAVMTKTSRSDAPGSAV